MEHTESSSHSHFYCRPGACSLRLAMRKWASSCEMSDFPWHSWHSASGPVTVEQLRNFVMGAVTQAVTINVITLLHPPFSGLVQHAKLQFHCSNIY